MFFLFTHPFFSFSKEGQRFTTLLNPPPHWLRMVRYDLHFKEVFMIRNTLFPLLTVSFLSSCTMINSTHHMTQPLQQGLITMSSPYSVNEILDRVTTEAKALGFKAPARINHSKAAKNVGLTLEATQVLLVGKPQGGTPLMKCAPTIAIDLPMKFMAYQDKMGKVWLVYNDLMYLKKRHHAQGCDQAFTKASSALKKIATTALKK